MQIVQSVWEENMEEIYSESIMTKEEVQHEYRIEQPPRGARGQIQRVDQDLGSRCSKKKKYTLTNGTPKSQNSKGMLEMPSTSNTMERLNRSETALKKSGERTCWAGSKALSHGRSAPPN